MWGEDIDAAQAPPTVQKSNCILGGFLSCTELSTHEATDCKVLLENQKYFPIIYKGLSQKRVKLTLTKHCSGPALKALMY